MKQSCARSAFLFALSSLAVVAGCGGDDDASATDAGVDAPVVSQVDATPPPGDSGSASAAAGDDVSVYLGRPVSLSAAASTGSGALTYAWTVTSAPPGSAVTTASITGADTATPSFSPDQPGVYTLTLKVSSGAASDEATVRVNAIDPPVFFAKTGNDDGGYEATFAVTGATAGDASTVSCFARDAGSPYDVLMSDVTRVGSDTWEAPPGQPSRLVFIFQTAVTPSKMILAATTSASSCATPPTILDTDEGESRSTARPFEQPRISPSGARVAYVRYTNGGGHIRTIGFDGKTPHELGASAAFPDGGPNPEAGPIPFSPTTRPVWIDDANVAWLQALDTDSWQIVTAPDKDGATPALLMRCTGELPYQFDVLTTGEVLVSQTTGTGSAAVRDLLVYSVDAATKDCTLARNLTQLTSVSGTSKATDFSLSPDRTRVAYLSYVDDGVSGYDVAVASVDGKSPPALVGKQSDAAHGPRWVGAGALLAWGGDGDVYDAGPGDAVTVALTDGGGAHAAALSSATGSAYAIGNGSRFGCSFAGLAGGSGVGAFGIAGLFFVRAWRRRRTPKA